MKDGSRIGYLRVQGSRGSSMSHPTTGYVAGTNEPSRTATSLWISTANGVPIEPFQSKAKSGRESPTPTEWASSCALFAASHRANFYDWIHSEFSGDSTRDNEGRIGFDPVVYAKPRQNRERR